MVKIKELEKLDSKNKTLTALISKAEQTNSDDIYDLKKELYTNKIRMIELITLEEKRAGITARELKHLVEIKPNVPRYETGVVAIDCKLHGGIEVGTLVQLAGESGAGKTHLLLEILSNIAHYSKAVFFNFEMGDTRIVQRLDRLLTRDVQWDNLIIDNDSRNIEALCNEITLYSRDGVKFFAIDSKMKLEVSGNKDEYQKFSEITKKLSALCQKLDVIVFLINQMNEQDIKNKRLAFKGSGDQQYDSDISLFYVVNKDNENPMEWKRTLICNKNRQDEELFAIDLDLDNSGKTVEAGIPITYEYQAPSNVTNYQDKVEMDVL